MRRPVGHLKTRAMPIRPGLGIRHVTPDRDADSLLLDMPAFADTGKEPLAWCCSQPSTHDARGATLKRNAEVACQGIAPHLELLDRHGPPQQAAGLLSDLVPFHR